MLAPFAFLGAIWSPSWSPFSTRLGARTAVKVGVRERLEFGHGPP